MDFNFTTETKLEELEREIMQRHRVYPRLIKNGKIDKDRAQRQLAIMSAVAKDYRDKLADGPLFNR